MHNMLIIHQTPDNQLFATIAGEKDCWSVNPYGEPSGLADLTDLWDGAQDQSRVYHQNLPLPSPAAVVAHMYPGVLTLLPDNMSVSTKRYFGIPQE